MTALTGELAAIVGEANCLTDDADRKRYETDITGAYRGRALAVVRPGSTAEVAAVMQLAHRTDTPVVPLSGNTGLSGGGFPGTDGRAIILSTERMNRIRHINPRSRIAIVEAGVILADMHAAAEAEGLVFPLTFGARGSCRIGGNLATNAGGSNVVRYGNTRDLCLGVEAVLADGTIVDLMSELHKDNTGYDLRDLLIGSEGTLGVITAAVLRLFPKPLVHATAMVAVPSIDSALALLHRVQEASGGAVEAFEFMPARHFEIIRQIDPKAPMFFDPPAEVTIMVEIASTARRDATPGPDGTVPLQELLEQVLAEQMEAGLVLDARLAASDSQRAEMWRQREMAFQVAMARGIPVATDIAVPLDRVERFMEQAEARITAALPGAESISVAHLGDGNVHYSVWVDPQPGRPVPPETATRVHEIVEDVVQELRGSFSAEHGVGVSKLGSMSRRKDPGALEMMRAIKAALDPKGILNPGKTVP